MLFIANEIDFSKRYNTDKENLENKMIGQFLILRNRQDDDDVYLCDFAIVTKKRVHYYNEFTRLLVTYQGTQGNAAELPMNSENFVNVDNAKKEGFNFFTQVISDESYYSLSSHYSKVRTKKIFSTLQDLGLMRKNGTSSKDYDLAKKCLLKHNRSYYAFNKGIEYLFTRDSKEFVKKTSIDQLDIQLEGITKNESLHLNFSHSVLGRIPINIFIGKNGAGKSYTIECIIKRYLEGRHQDLASNINKIIVISNTISDKYPSTIRKFKSNKRLSDDNTNEDYEYFSTIRGCKFNQTDGVQKFNFTTHIEEMLVRDMTEQLPFSSLDILEKAIKKNLSCSIIGLDSNLTSFKSLRELIFSAKKHFNETDGEYLRLDHVFITRNGREAKLSSGQENFILMISCLLTSIQNNSLVFIDELENFLHPNFISQAMKILKDCLIDTNSICIIATHSLHIAREIPKEGVTIFERFNDASSLVIYNPGIESYSCNLQLMSNYIFNTKEEESIFDSTLRNIANKYKTKKKLINELGGSTSRDILLSIADRINEN